MSATATVRRALEGTGVDLVASAPASAYDARAPGPLRSERLLPGARGIVVVASAGRALWRAFRTWTGEERARWDLAHPLDTFVAVRLALADEALARAGVGFRRFEPTVVASPALDFRALGAIVGLGSPGPFGMLIHAEHGAWWALRGAWLVDAEVDAPLAHAPPCTGCHAPCVGGRGESIAVASATPEVRGRCVVGQASRYDDEQIAYHYDRQSTLAILRAR